MYSCYKCGIACDKLCDTTHLVMVKEGTRQIKQILCNECYFLKIQEVLKNASIVFNAETKLVLCDDGSWEPYEYYIWTDSFKVDKGHETCKATPPRAAFDSNKQLWKLEYSSANPGGYGIRNFVKYFDNQPALMGFLCHN